MSRKPTEKGYAVILSFEGIALRAYQDAVGVWTIAGGITNYDKGAVARIGKIQRGLTLTMPVALELTKDSIDNRYAPAVDKALPGVTDPQFDAGTSFHFNTGAIGRASWVPALLQKNMDRVHASIMSWNRAGGRVLAGLTRRRNREWEMISKGDYGPEATTPPLVLDEHGRPTGERVSINVGSAKTGTTTKEVEVSTVQKTRTPEEVRDLQTDLKALGLYTGQIDGIYGPKTEAGVRKFQESHPNVTADGKAGRATEAAIHREVAMRTKAKRVTKVGTVITTASTAATFAGLIGKLVPFILFAAVIGVLAYIGYRYRFELIARFNRIRGKAVK